MSVHKRRVRYAPNGCSAEITDVVADGRSARTFAVEGEDAAAVADVVRSLGLADFLNTAYPVGLARIMEGTPNAMQSSTAARTRSSSTSPSERPRAAGSMLVDRAELTRLGEGDRGRTVGHQSAALERTATAVDGMVEEARSHDVIAIAAVGTAGLRMASNRDKVRARSPSGPGSRSR